LEEAVGAALWYEPDSHAGDTGRQEVSWVLLQAACTYAEPGQELQTTQRFALVSAKKFGGHDATQEPLLSSRSPALHATHCDTAGPVQVEQAVAAHGWHVRLASA